MEHEHASNYKVYRLCIENQNISDHTNKQPGAIPCLTTFMHRLDVDVEAQNRIFAFHLGSTDVVLRRKNIHWICREEPSQEPSGSHYSLQQATAKDRSGRHNDQHLQWSTPAHCHLIVESLAHACWPRGATWSEHEHQRKITQ